MKLLRRLPLRRRAIVHEIGPAVADTWWYGLPVCVLPRAERLAPRRVPARPADVRLMPDEKGVA